MNSTPDSLTSDQPRNAGKMAGEVSASAKADAILAMASGLQPLPAILTHLAALLDRADSDLNAIADIIRLDPVLTLKLLRTANSAISAGAVEVSTAEEAVMRLGIGLVTSTIFAFSVGKLMSTALPVYDLAAGQLWRHAAASAVAAEILVRKDPDHIPPATVTAALLHDVGKLVVAQSASAEEMAFVRRARQEAGLSLEEAEMEILEMNHAEVGYIVARHWGLPERICRAIMYHHTPEQWDDRMCDALHVANLAAHAIEIPEGDTEPIVSPAPEVIARLALGSLDFEKLCAQTASRFSQLRTLYGA